MKKKPVIEKPKCRIKGHEGNEYIYICTNEICQKPDRVLCTKCAINHGDAQNFVLIDDMLF